MRRWAPVQYLEHKEVWGLGDHNFEDDIVYGIEALVIKNNRWGWDYIIFSTGDKGRVLDRIGAIHEVTSKIK